MTTLDELEKLAHAAQTERYLRLAHQQKFHAAATPQTIKQLIALCRLQHEALSEVVGTTHSVDEALEAYEQIMGEK